MENGGKQNGDWNNGGKWERKSNRPGIGCFKRPRLNRNANTNVDACYSLI